MTNQQSAKRLVDPIQTLSDLPAITSEPRYSVRVTTLDRLSPTLLSLTFNRPDGFGFEAGQFVWLVLPKLTKVGGVIDRRMYAIASATDAIGVTVLVDLDDSSYASLLASMTVGAKVDLVGPVGSVYDISPSGAVLIVDGESIAPMLSNMRSKVVDELTIAIYNHKKLPGAIAEELNLFAGKHNYDLKYINNYPKRSDFKYLTNGEDRPV